MGAIYDNSPTWQIARYLRDIASWIDEAQDPNVPEHKKIDFGDIPSELLRSAASRLDRSTR